MICRVFVVVFSWTSFRLRCGLEVSLPEFYGKTAEINGLTGLQFLFGDI